MQKPTIDASDLKPISFDNTATGSPLEDVYRGAPSVASRSFDLGHSFGSLSTAFVPTQSLSKSAGTLLRTTPVTSNPHGLDKSFEKQAVAPLEFVCTVVDETPLDLSCPPSLSSLSAPSENFTATTNNLNSFLAKNFSCSQASSHLCRVLRENYTDLELHSQPDASRVDGLVFLGHHAVSFMLYFHRASNDKTSTSCEFRRCSGDALAAAKLWADIRDLFLEQKLTCCLALDTTDLPSLPNLVTDITLSIQELDEIAQSIAENDCFVVDDLSLLLERISGNDKLCSQVLCHQQLLLELVNHALVNQDICVVRLAALILQEVAHCNLFATSEQEAMTSPTMFIHLQQLLSHSTQLLHKYGIRLLISLGTIRHQWSIESNLQQQLLTDLVRCCNISQEDMTNARQVLMGC